jgi:hypothetical protein
MACKSNVQFFTDGQPPNTPGGDLDAAALQSDRARGQCADAPGATRGQFRWKRALNPKGILNPGKFAEGNDLLNRTVAVFAERDCGVMDSVRICWTTISVCLTVIL